MYSKPNQGVASPEAHTQTHESLTDGHRVPGVYPKQLTKCRAKPAGRYGGLHLPSTVNFRQQSPITVGCRAACPRLRLIGPPFPPGAPFFPLSAASLDSDLHRSHHTLTLPYLAVHRPIRPGALLQQPQAGKAGGQAELAHQGARRRVLHQGRGAEVLAGPPEPGPPRQQGQRVPPLQG